MIGFTTEATPFQRMGMKAAASGTGRRSANQCPTLCSGVRQAGMPAWDVADAHRGNAG
ncbi:hypothetical protein [Marivita cryptomonadis]|uniref:hypothetical protein n=1 Tax=Marivita cryptomonadis TaxID=505252 RepID=UPI00391C2223